MHKKEFMRMEIHSTQFSKKQVKVTNRNKIIIIDSSRISKHFGIKDFSFYFQYELIGSIQIDHIL